MSNPGSIRHHRASAATWYIGSIPSKENHWGQSSAQLAAAFKRLKKAIRCQNSRLSQPGVKQWTLASTLAATCQSHTLLAQSWNEESGLFEGLW